MKHIAKLSVSLSMLAFQVIAADCSFDIDVGDNLAFSKTSIEISKSACSAVTINLKHTGKMAKNFMGHNWVLASTADLQPIATAGQQAGLNSNYVPAGDARVLASSKVIGGGESTSITFSTSALTAGGDYTYFCSFPGHWAVMKGKFNVKA